MQYVASADLCVANLSSKWYPSVPTKVSEYFALGKRVLMSRYGISRDVRDCGRSIVVDPNDQSEMVSTVIQCLSTVDEDKALSSRVHEYTWDNIVTKM